jgi:predicted ABC-type ATPase
MGRSEAIYGNTSSPMRAGPSGSSIRRFHRAFVPLERLTQQAANLVAVQRIETWLQASIDAHQSIGVETVLSTNKYRRLVEAAKQRGYEIRLIYVILQNADLNVERVRLRVQKGGHNVPAGKVRERWTRSLKQLPWFLNQADWALLFDNSAELRVIGRKEGGVVVLDPTAPPDVQKAVQKIRSARKS